MAEGEGIAAASATPWISYAFSGLALAVSMASFWNARQARKEAGKSRRSQFIFSEFDRQIRTPVENSLASINSVRKRLELTPQTSRSRALSDIKSDASKNITQAHPDIQSLLDLLERANRTQFTQGDDWLSVAQSPHDALLTAETAISAANNFDETMMAITQAARALSDLESSVRTRIDRQLREHVE